MNSVEMVNKKSKVTNMFRDQMYVPVCIAVILLHALNETRKHERSKKYCFFGFEQTLYFEVTY